MPPLARSLAAEPFTQIGALDAAAVVAERRITNLVKAQSAAQLVLTIPGIEPPHASAFPATIPDVQSMPTGAPSPPRLAWCPSRMRAAARPSPARLPTRGSLPRRAAGARRPRSPGQGGAHQGPVGRKFHRLGLGASPTHAKEPRRSGAIAKKRARIVWAVLAFNRPSRSRAGRESLRRLMA